MDVSAPSRPHRRPDGNRFSEAIRPARREDLEAIARIHADSGTPGLLSDLGREFLRRIYYRGILESTVGDIRVIEVRGAVAGFVTFSTNSDRLFPDVMLRRWPLAAYLVLRRGARHPRVLRDLLETVLHVRRHRLDPDIHGEVVSLEIDRAYQGAGLGLFLMERAVQELAERGTVAFRSRTLVSNLPVEHLHEFCGFSCVGSFRLHRRAWHMWVWRHEPPDAVAVLQPDATKPAPPVEPGAARRPAQAIGGVRRGRTKGSAAEPQPDALAIETSYDWLVAGREERARIREARGLDADARRLDAEQTAAVARYGRSAPLFSRVPIPYRVVPLRVRTALLGLKFRVDARRLGDSAFPDWPVEDGIDRARAEVWARAASAAGVAARRPQWPNGRIAALVLTHDVDSRPELELIPAIRAAERERGVVSAFGFVPRISWPDQRMAEQIVAEGGEIYCHDVAHDARLPAMPQDAAAEALGTVFETHRWARPLVRGFRSGQLLMSPDLRGAVRQLFDYDLSIPDTERGGAYGFAAGCATVFPFVAGGLLEIPLTMPQDVFLRQVHRLSPAESLATWLRKLEYVKAAGGVAVLNVHPTWVNPARAGMWQVYLDLLESAAGDERVWLTTPGGLAAWLEARRTAD